MEPPTKRELEDLEREIEQAETKAARAAQRRADILSREARLARDRANLLAGRPTRRRAKYDASGWPLELRVLRLMAKDTALFIVWILLRHAAEEVSAWWPVSPLDHQGAEIWSIFSLVVTLVVVAIVTIRDLSDILR